jgi:hypothetical protein
MPDWNSGVAGVNVNGTRSVAVRMQYPGGYSYSVQIGNGLIGGANYTVNEVSSFRAALGGVSNFAVREQVETLIDSVAPSNTLAYDDAYGPNVTMNLRFTNNSQETFTVTVPGPRKELFAGNGIGLVTPDLSAAAGTPERLLAELVRDTQNLVNQSFVPSNTYSFSGGERARRAMKPSSRPDTIPFEEPLTDSIQP